MHHVMNGAGARVGELGKLVTRGNTYAVTREPRSPSRAGSLCGRMRILSCDSASHRCAAIEAGALPACLRCRISSSRPTTEAPLHLRKPIATTPHSKETRMKDLDYAPPSFTTLDGKKVVFVDFIEAHYTLLFDPTTPDALVESHITFEARDEGFPAISLQQPFVSGTLDRESVTLDEPRSKDETISFQILSKPVLPGPHELHIRSKISRPVVTPNHPITRLPRLRRLECKFSMSDIAPDAGFLDAYLPANLEYDHVKMRFNVRIENSSVNHTVFSNGTVSDVAQGQWEIDFPEFFTSSCPWFHIGPLDIYRSLKGVFRSADNRDIPLFVYTHYKWLKEGVDLDEFLTLTQIYLSDLERDFGPFPHESVRIFARRPWGGGMEYAGAAATSIGALRHELDHSYFARSITPVDGNAGWMDEAIAWWGDRCYPTYVKQHSSRANLARRSRYIPTTNDKSYDVGSDFFAYLNSVLSEHGGVKPFLRHYAQSRKHQSISVDEFQTMIKNFYGASIDDLFEYHVYSEDSTSTPQMLRHQPATPTSPHVSFDDLIVDLADEE